MTRPAIDVVVPFVGTDGELRETLAHFRALSLGPEDSLTLVDNRPVAMSAPPPEVVAAPERQSSYFARNAGARIGSNPWLLFLDADVRAPADLLDLYLDGYEPPNDVGVLAGGITTTLASSTAVARYGYAAQQLSPRYAARAGHEYAQTANAAFRRAGFEQVGGFFDRVRSGGDADMSFRMADAGWRLERRHDAAVEHPSRASLRALLRLFARYGSGAEWVRGRHPGFRPPQSRAGLSRWLLRGLVQGAVSYARGERDEATRLVLDPATRLAFELGRSFPNEVDAPPPANLSERLLRRAARIG